MTSTIAEIAADQRIANARRLTAALSGLTLLSVPPAFVLGAAADVLGVLTAAATGFAVAYWLARTGRASAGVMLAACCFWLQHVAVVAALGRLGPVPFLAPLMVLAVAAAAESRWLPLALVLALSSLAAEARLSPWTTDDQATLVAATLFLVTVFVVSLLHVAGTERAFAVAEAQDAARSVAATQARESEQRYRLIADNTDDLIALVAADGRCLYLSPSHARRFGVDVEQRVDGPVTDVLSIVNLDEARQAFRRALADGRATVDLQVAVPSGELRRLDSSLQRAPSPDGPLVVVISRDVTERRTLEQRLLAAERSESLGRLAGSVAHDFNNLLTVIGGGVELARLRLEPNHPAQVDLGAALEATATATKLTRQLLTFSRRQVVVREPLDVGDELERHRDLLERLVGRHVRLQLERGEGLPRVTMHAGHLEQLVMNLLVNAKDAMPTGGQLRVTLCDRAVAEGEVAELTPGRYVELRVADDGVGVPPEILPRIFEPAFSTKGEQGTGLGLATCASIVADAHGHIGVESEVGRGTTFTILLPATDEDLEVARPAATAGSIHEVLVVDDEPTVRETTERLLLGLGFAVRSAASLEGAHQVLQDPSIPIDALLTDVVLGSDRGTDLVSVCRRVRPEATIVVMSGYAPDPGASALLEQHGARFLAKPFTRAELIAALGDHDPAREA